MKNKSKKIKIIIGLAVIYVFIIIGLLCREKILHIDDSLLQQKAQESTQNAANDEPKSYDYAAAYEKAKSSIPYDMDKAPIQIQETDCASVIESNHLPPLERMEQGDSEKLMSQLQVLQKIKTLGIDTKTFETPELNWKNLYNTVSLESEEQQAYVNKVTFTGRTASALNAFISQQENAYITISSDTIVLDETIKLKSNIALDGQGVHFVAGNVMLKQAILAEDCSDFRITGVALLEGNYNFGIYIIQSNQFTVDDCQISQSVQKGLVIMGTNSDFIIKSNVISVNGNGGMLFNGNISRGIIQENTSINNNGTRNLAAGFALSAITIDDIYTPYNYETFKDEHLYDMTDAPHDLVIYKNKIEQNNSSGIYSDGSYCSYFVENSIVNNDKEGICLDYGTFGDYLGNNTIQENGGRLRQSDDALAADFITSFGRLQDGSSPSKLPGISMDNCAYNTILYNNVEKNYGSGIKMVRSSYRNIIMVNTVNDNNSGQSDNFHFFGIELGHASTPDEPVKGLDFTPDYENLVCRNIVTGRNYAGVYLGEDSYCNDVFDNIILNSQLFAIESHSTKFNSIVNNTIDQISLNDFHK